MSHFQRFRPLRKNQAIRDEHSEVMIAPSDFIVPFFVVSGNGVKQEISGLTGIYHYSPDTLANEIQDCLALGINKFLLFGVVSSSQCDEQGAYAADEQSPVVIALKQLKSQFPQAKWFSDICICGYTTHGHCGVVNQQEILNDESLPALARMALAHAEAGADYVAPSAMMDGQVWAIRQALDSAGYSRVQILSYSAKYASCFYGPFRQAVDSAPSFGDRKTYQMDARNRTQAVQEVRADLEEGASAVMVKPALAYLDIVFEIRQAFPDVCLAAYHVSGEYMMVKYAAKAGAFDEQAAWAEVFYGFKRAGADWIISYAAPQFWKKERA